MAASYEAKACGVHGGMGGGQARRLCPDAVVVSPDFESYSVASRELFEVFRDTAPVVEGLGMEEAFMDVSGLERISGKPPRIAERLRIRVASELRLPISVGVARTKFMAKMGSRAAKPDGLMVIEPDRELDFLLPLPVESLWGVGPASAARLHAHGIETVRRRSAGGARGADRDPGPGGWAARPRPGAQPRPPPRARRPPAQLGRRAVGDGPRAAYRRRDRHAGLSPWSSGSRAGCERPAGWGGP